jgi:peptidoglycan/LPS O-acetylase OafA/YrhL
MTDQQRFHSLDALRASALLLGIALHATMSFLPGFRETGWPISDASESASMGVLFYVVHIFRMATFFLVAGFFARLLFQRLGTGGFIRNRLRRIALPLVAFYPVVMPLCILPIIWAVKQMGVTAGAGRPAGFPQGFHWGHFWFLYLLLVLYALALFGRAAVVAADRQGVFRAFIDRVLRKSLEFRIAPLLLAVPLAALLYATPWWLQWPGIPTPLAGFVPNFPAVACFGAAMIFGWCLHRQQSLFDLLRRDCVWYLAVAAVASVVALSLVGVKMKALTVIALTPEIRAAYALAYMLAVWCWSLGLTGAAVAWLSTPSARWRYLSDASYWMYLVHVPIVWALQAWMMRWTLHWSIKYALILAIACALLLASYHYLVRSTFLGKFLNGRKYPRALPQVAAAPSTSAV